MKFRSGDFNMKKCKQSDGPCAADCNGQIARVRQFGTSNGH